MLTKDYKLMKNSNQQRPLQGFTLIELLVVMLIIITLAGITLGALVGANKGADRRVTTALLGELEAGLSRYEVDFGHYPISPVEGVTGEDAATRDSEGRLGAEILYQHLSGDFDLDDDGEKDADQKAYVRGLTWAENRPKKSKKSKPSPYSEGNARIIVDPYDAAIRYLAEKPVKRDKLTINPDYDLWSTAGSSVQEIGEEGVQERYITNWTSSN